MTAEEFCCFSMRYRPALAGRGHLFAYQGADVAPDILASAKGLGNGFPVAACLATEAAASGMTPGTHGSTFGGNPLAMAVASEVIDIVLEPGFLEQVRDRGDYLRVALLALVERYPRIFEGIHGEGLLLGLKCRRPVAEVASVARDEGLLTVVAGDNVLGILPPLTISLEEIDEGVSRLIDAAETLGSFRRAWSMTSSSDARRLTGAPDPITHVAVKAWRDRFLEMNRKLPEESAVALSYDRVTFAMMMASPQDLHDFAVGFSLSEGIIERPADILDFELAVLPQGLECRMELAPAPARGAGSAAPAHRRPGRLRPLRHGQPSRGAAPAKARER